MDYKKWLKNQKIVCMIIGVILFFIFMLFVFFTVNQSSSESEFEPIMFASSSEETISKIEEDDSLFIDVKGAVEKPGMYQGEKNMRVWDVVQLAGGVKESADTKQVNFSLRITDQMVIYVPEKGEVVESGLMSNVEEKNTSEQQSDQTKKVNLNQATEEELQTLTGVGQKKAQEIIRYREENGGFTSIEELKNIAGIGEKTFQKLEDSIIV